MTQSLFRPVILIIRIYYESLTYGYYFKKQLTKRQHVGNSFCCYDDRLVLGGRRACCQLLMDDSSSRRIRYQLHPHRQNKLFYVLKRRRQTVSHYCKKKIHIQQHKYTALSVVSIHVIRVWFVYNFCKPLYHHTPVRFRNSLTNRDLSHTSRNEVKEVRSKRYLSLSPSLSPISGS